MIPLILILKWAAILIGSGICADGIGSILIKQGQYHTFWFDFEREVRSGVGAFLCILGILSLVL